MTMLTHRYKVWLVLEAETPLSIGSGREGLTTDRLVARNAAGFPCMPGSGLAGALRAAMPDMLNRTDLLSIFGFADKDLSKDEKKEAKRQQTPTSLGSRLIVNNAHLLAADGKTVLEGLTDVDETTKYYQHLSALPVRDHVRLNDRGVAADKGKFDEQLCYKGVRFVGSLELLGMEADKDRWQQILSQLAAPFFRIGGGTRKGFGKLKIVKLQGKTYNLCDANDRNAYLKDDNSLQTPGDAKEPGFKMPAVEKFRRYTLTLKPRDFFFFGAGYGDDEADDIYKCEPIIDWSSGKAQVSEQKILIPATSVKGALRHRLAFHYNKEQKTFISGNDDGKKAILNEQLEKLNEMANVPEGISSENAWWETTLEKLKNASFELEVKGNRSESKADIAAQNEAVKALFGYAADQTAGEDAKGQRGNVLFSDVFLQTAKEKIFDHVRIDRFTGGASDGALFQEKTVFAKDAFTLELFVAEQALKNPVIERAWHATLADLCEGRLPLGGRTTKGHGFFTGNCEPEIKNTIQS